MTYKRYAAKTGIKLHRFVLEMAPNDYEFFTDYQRKCGSKVSRREAMARLIREYIEMKERLDDWYLESREDY